MGKRIKAFTYYALFWLLFFFVARLFFILTQFKQASGFNLETLAATFTHGIKLDISAIGYIVLIPALLAIPALYFNGSWYRIFLKIYTFLFIVFASAIMTGDAVLYKYWGFRMDFTPFLYLETPKEAIASANTFEMIMVPLGIIFFSVLFIYLYNLFIDRLFIGFERVRYLVIAGLFLVVLWAGLIIPIRGGVGVAPINAGSVYFNEAIFINHTAINVFWNVGQSMFYSEPASNPYNYGDPLTAKTMVDSLMLDKGQPVKVLTHGKPNVLIIILEGFGSSMIGPLGGDPLTTPVFNSYVDEGILFTNFFASGPRTDKALPAILNGYPAQPAASIMKEPEKTQSLPGIIRTLIESGYSSSFWYGGDINFANLNSFVINSGFRTIITKKNFDPVHYNSKWGVHDNVLFETLADSIKNEKEPFVKVVLTLSSHEPFEIPMEPVFEEKDEVDKYKNSVYYADRSLGYFLDKSRQHDWWKNTLVILVADHCRRNGDEGPDDLEGLFRIPMLWIGGALAKTGFKVEKYGSQTDIPITLLNQLDKKVPFPFGKDLFSEGSNSFAFYTFNEGFGFVTDTSCCIYDHKLGAPLFERGPSAKSAGTYGKAFLQVMFDDFLQR